MSLGPYSLCLKDLNFRSNQIVRNISISKFPCVQQSLHLKELLIKLEIVKRKIQPLFKVFFIKNKMTIILQLVLPVFLLLTEDANKFFLKKKLLLSFLSFTLFCVYPLNLKLGKIFLNSLSCKNSQNPCN